MPAEIAAFEFSVCSSTSMRVSKLTSGFRRAAAGADAADVGFGESRSFADATGILRAAFVLHKCTYCPVGGREGGV